jgi:hypothetical protein
MSNSLRNFTSGLRTLLGECVLTGVLQRPETFLVKAVRTLLVMDCRVPMPQFWTDGKEAVALGGTVQGLSYCMRESIVAGATATTVEARAPIPAM